MAEGCRHPHRVLIARLACRGAMLTGPLLNEMWDDGLFEPKPGELRPSVELLSVEPEYQTGYTVVEVN